MTNQLPALRQTWRGLVGTLKQVVRTSSLVVLGMTLSGSALEAQSAQRWSIQGSLLYVGAYGEAYEGLDAGPGAELQLRFTPSQLSIGAGVQSSSHSVDLDELGVHDVTLTGGFIEPRYVFDMGSDRAAPYGAARLAFLQQSLSVEGITASASGTQVNIGGGVLVRMSPRINLDFGATFGVINFGDIELSYQGETVSIPGSSGSGNNLVLRAGMAFGFR